MSDVEEAIALLNNAIDILTANTPDMDVTEFNATPTGRAVSRIMAAIEKLVGDDE